MKSTTVILLLLITNSILAQIKDSTRKFNSEKMLDAAVIKNKKPFIEIQADKMVLNVQQDIVAGSGNIFDILQRAPGVSVMNEEAITLAGKSGINVLIDGRPTQLSGKDLANYLKATPGSLVDKVEIIMNPSAKYDAQGNAGIINIRMKKNILKGTNGNIVASYTQGDHPNYNLASTFNYRKGKWNWYSNIAARKWRQNTDGTINRFVNSSGTYKTFENKTVDQDASENLGYKAGADWYLNRSNTFGFIIKGNEYKSRLYTPGITLIKSFDIVDSSLHTINDNRERTSSNNINFNYRYEDTLGAELNLDADFTRFSKNKNGYVTTDLLNKQNIVYGYTANDQDVLNKVIVYSIKSDFTKAFKKLNAKMEAGLKWNTVQTTNDLEALLWQGSQFIADTGRTNKFRYTETVYAAYNSFSQKIKKWEYQVGARAEYTVIKGKNTDLKQNTLSYPDTSYLSIFPTAFLRFTINEKNNIGISYGRRINRPDYNDLNPFEYIYDNYSREKGNPYLQPEYSNNAELSYSYHGALNIAMGYSYTTNTFQTISTLNGEITSATQYNVGKENRWYMNISLGMPVTKWWNSYINLGPHYKQFRGKIEQGVLDNNAWGMSWYASENFTLPQKWKIQLSSWGSIATRDAMNRTAWLGSVDAGVSKLLCKDKLNIRLSATDIFHTQRWMQEVDFGNVQYNYLRQWESRTVRLQLTWKFGRTNYNARERELGAQGEINRIK